jgi:hypothetical protein
VRQKSPVLLDISDSSAQQHGRLSANIFVADNDLATLRFYKSVEATEKRGLSGPALADERNGPSAWNVDAHIVERDHGSEAM